MTGRIFKDNNRNEFKVIDNSLRYLAVAQILLPYPLSMVDYPWSILQNLNFGVLLSFGERFL